MTQSGKSNQLNDLITDICKDMNAIDNSTLPLGLDDPKAFEFSILLILLDALNEIDGVENITPCQLDSQSSRFLVPGGPRLFYSKFSFYAFDYKTSSYEVHLGVQYKGDTTLHEADVSIIKKTHATKSRNNNKSPKKESLVAWFECKYYTGSLKIAESRQLVGLKDDFHKDGILYFVSNSSGGSSREYFSKPNRPDLYESIKFNQRKSSLKNFKENIKSDIRKRLVYLEKDK